MKTDSPFNLAFDFLKKSRLNKEILEDMLRRLGGISEEEKKDMLSNHELAAMKRAHFLNQVASPHGRYAQQFGNIGPDEEKFPSLRFKRERDVSEIKDRLEDEDSEREKEYEKQILENKLANIDAAHTRESREADNKFWLEQFEQSDTAKKLRDALEERKRARKINDITGVKVPLPSIRETLTATENRPTNLRRVANLGEDPHATPRALFNENHWITGLSSEDQALLHQLKGGSGDALEMMQAHKTSPTGLVGDMPLEEFEKVYDTEMPVPEPKIPPEERCPIHGTPLQDWGHGDGKIDCPTCGMGTAEENEALAWKNAPDNYDMTEEETREFMQNLF